MVYLRKHAQLIQFISDHKHYLCETNGHTTTGRTKLSKKTNCWNKGRKYLLWVNVSHPNFDGKKPGWADLAHSWQLLEHLKKDCHTSDGSPDTKRYKDLLNDPGEFLCLSGGLSDVWETHKTWVGSSALFKQAASLPPALTSVIWKLGYLHVCKHWLGINVPHHLQDAQEFLHPSICACTCTTLCHLHCTKQKRWLIHFFSTPTKFAMMLNSQPYDPSSALESTCPRGMCFSNVITELPLLKLREVLTWADQSWCLVVTLVLT